MSVATSPHTIRTEIHAASSGGKAAAAGAASAGAIAMAHGGCAA